MKLRAIIKKVEHIKVWKNNDTLKNQKEKLIIKSIITEIENPIHNLIRRLDMAKETIIELPKLKKKQKKLINKQTIQELWKISKVVLYISLEYQKEKKYLP